MRNQRPLQGLAILLALVMLCASCGSRVEGTYSDMSGGIMLELKSGNQATFTFAGDAVACNYQLDGNQLTLDCKGDKMAFTIHDDGSLTGPPGSLMGALRKAKT